MLPSQNTSGSLLTVLSLFQVATAQQQQVGEGAGLKERKVAVGVYPSGKGGTWQPCAELAGTHGGFAGLP